MRWDDPKTNRQHFFLLFSFQKWIEWRRTGRVSCFSCRTWVCWWVGPVSCSLHSLKINWSSKCCFSLGQNETICFLVLCWKYLFSVADVCSPSPFQSLLVDTGFTTKCVVVSCMNPVFLYPVIYFCMLGIRMTLNRFNSNNLTWKHQV